MQRARSQLNEQLPLCRDHKSSSFDWIHCGMRSIAVISGGTATNHLTHVFDTLALRVDYVLPILDNGGSTSEIIRVIGGPAIGDIRSRLTRLIPLERIYLKELLSYRLSADPVEARGEWNEIVEGSHKVWYEFPLSTKEIVRSFLVHIHVELLKRSKITLSNSGNKQFRYELASVGNLFLTALRLFIGSLDSAIELFSKITDIIDDVRVLPCINTNFTYHIGALLKNGTIITGQSQISHPSLSEAYPPPIVKTRPSTPTELLCSNDCSEKPKEKCSLPNLERSWSSDEEAGNIPLYTHPELKKSQLHFDKSSTLDPLLSPIERIFYISPYGEEICPMAHSQVISAVNNANVLVFSIGSLMTSILPVIILKGMGKAIAYPRHHSRKSILLLNGLEDRETCGMTAIDFVRRIVELAQYSLNKSSQPVVLDWERFITHLFYMESPKIHVQVEELQRHGIRCVQIKRSAGAADCFDDEDLELHLRVISHQ